MKLKNQILLLLVVAVLIPLISAISYALFQNHKSTQEIVLVSAQNQLQNAASTLQGYFDARKSEMELLAINPSVRTMDFTQMRPVLMQSLELKSKYYEKFIIGRDDGAFYNTSGANPYLGMLRTSDDNSKDATPKSILSRDYWINTVGVSLLQNSETLPSVYISNPMISYTTEVKQVVIAAPILNSENKVSGLIGGALPWEYIKEEVLKIDKTTREALFDSAKIALISKDGTYWYHWDESKVIQFAKDQNQNYILNSRSEKMTKKHSINDEFKNKEMDFMEQLIESSKSSFYSGNDNSNKKHLFWEVGDTGYTLQLTFDNKHIQENENALMKYLMITIIVAFIFSILCAFILVRKITEPLQKFTKKLGRLEGRSVVNIEYDTNTLEFKNLFKQFNAIVNMMRENEETLMESEQRFYLAMKGSNDGLWDWHVNSEKIYLSPRWKSMLGFEMHEVKDEIESISKLIHKPDLERVTQLLMGYVDGLSDTYECEFNMVHKNGTLVSVLSRGFAVRGNNGKALRIVGTNIDVTSRKLQDKKLRELNDSLEKRVNDRTKELEIKNKELENANKIADSASQAKSMFLANMSHEIRTPMNGVIGLTDLVLKNELPEKQRKYIEKIKRSSAHLMHILNDILDLSKIEAGKLTIEKITFDLIKTSKDVISVHEVNAHDKKIDIKLTLKGDAKNQLNALIGDPVRYSQVLSNLISNAIKFTDHGKVEVVLEIHENKIMTTVIDQGIGISNDQINKLFNNFSQADDSTSRKYGGTGLGLAICKYLVEAMGGEIQVKSELQNGSAFSFSIEMQKATQEDLKQESNQQIKSVPVENKRMLLVEDTAINLIIAEEVFVQAGMIVETAENGQIAVDIAKDNDYDIIIMDIQMPVMDGYEATKNIREMSRHINTPIVAMTANAMSDDKELSLKSGMNGHICKPIDIDTIVSEVAKYMN